MRLDETDEDNTDGLKLASKIKECWPSVEVVIITGYQTPETLREAMEPDSLGARLVADFIPKTQTEDLIRAVKRALSEHH
jgi:DNA-binding NtrC family response regulator